MNQIARFEKVSFEQFKEDCINCLGENVQGIKEAYDSIKLPVRATKGSAGYDVFTPFAINLKPGDGIKIPTGIRVKIDEGWVLLVMPKSGLGVKNRFQLDNTVGVIDSDYYNSDNQGHILIAMRNNCTTQELKDISIPAGKAFSQAIFVPFGITEDDNTDGVRDGGFGSTGA